MKSIFTALAISLCLAASYGSYQWSLKQDRRVDEPRPKPPLAVEVSQVQQFDLTEKAELIGSLEPRADVEIRSRIRGYITRLPYDIGDFIEQTGNDDGPVVVEIEDEIAREALKGAEAALAVAEAQLQAKKVMQTFAQRYFDRHKDLVGSGAVTAQELEQFAADLEIATAEVKQEEARVAQAASEVERSRLGLAQTRIHAPSSGYAAERFVEVGTLANPDDPLLRIVDISDVTTVVFVGEENYGKVQVGQQANVRVDAFPDETFVGHVTRKAPVLDLETRMAAVHIEIGNRQAKLRPGMHARVSVITGRKPKAMVVPIAALQEHTNPPTLFVLNGQFVEKRNVAIGILQDDFVEIHSGLKEGEWVVTLGSRLVENGQQVTAIRTTEQVAGRNTIDPIVTRNFSHGGE